MTSTLISPQVSLHFILSISHEGYGHMSLSSLKGHIHATVLYGQNSTLVAAETPEPSDRRANATFVFLARNSDLEGVVDSIRQMEDRFNYKYQYPWVLLNEEPFTETFKRLACFTMQF
jgi:alpha 1,2-mannosyltransferase